MENLLQQNNNKVESGSGAEKIKNPPIVYTEVLINDDYIKNNLLPNGGLRMKGGHANWNGEVELMKYVISENLSPEQRVFVEDKIRKLEAGQEKTYQHESHHINNRENNLTPHLAAENLREFLAFRVLDELSAFTTAELYRQDFTAENILQALKTSKQKIVDSYYGQPFSNEAKWFLSQHDRDLEVLSRKINTEKYHQVMRQYFNINGQDILTILQKDGKMPDFTEIVNDLIITLDRLLKSDK